MIFYYLDASVWVKRYHLEPGTTWVTELFEQGPAVFCASLGFIEVSATLTRKQKTGAFDRLQLEEKLRHLDNDWHNFLQLQFSADMVESAATVARQYALRGADAIHLASALFVQTNFTEATDEFVFAAADRELLAAAASAGLRVFDPTAQ